MNYEEDIRIDESALDIEWLEQPNLMMRYGRISAEARQEVDRAKEKLDLVKAELDRDIRSNPEAYGLGKITEDVVKNTILLQTPYKEASEALIQAKFESDVAYTAVKAFDARKDALENLVRLNGQQYFAGPKMPRDLKEEREAFTKNLNASIASKMKRRRDV